MSTRNNRNRPGGGAGQADRRPRLAPVRCPRRWSVACLVATCLPAIFALVMVARADSELDRIIAKIDEAESKIQHISLSMRVYHEGTLQPVLDAKWLFSEGRECIDGRRFYIRNNEDTEPYPIRQRHSFNGTSQVFWSYDHEKNVPTGRIGSFSPDSFIGLTTVRALLGGQITRTGRLSLAECLRRVKPENISVDRDVVDNQECILLSVKGVREFSGGRGMDVKMWFSAEKDYRLLKMEVYANNREGEHFQFLKRRFDMITLAQINGIWFPIYGRGTSFFRTAGGKETHINPEVPPRIVEVDPMSVRFLESIPDSEFGPKWPAGCVVWDEALGKVVDPDKITSGQPGFVDDLLLDWRTEDAERELVAALNRSIGADEVENIARRWQSQGVDPVPILFRHSRLHPGVAMAEKRQRFKLVVHVLSALGTPEAKDVLFELTFENNAPSVEISREAARAYLELCDSPEEKMRLLDAPDSARSMMLQSLLGHSLTPEIVEELCGIFGEESEHFSEHHHDLLRILEGDGSFLTLEVRIDAVLGIGEKLAQWMERSFEERRGWEPHYGDFIWRDEWVYHSYVEGLSNFVGARAALRQRVERETGRRRFMCVLALGLLGDLSVRDQLLELLDSEKNGILRSYIVMSLGPVSVPEDMERLRELATNDHFIREQYKPPLAGIRVNIPGLNLPFISNGPLEGGMDIDPEFTKVIVRYVVRDAAERVLRKLKEERSEKD